VLVTFFGQKLAFKLCKQKQNANNNEIAVAESTNNNCMGWL